MRSSGVVACLLALLVSVGGCRTGEEQSSDPVQTPSEAFKGTRADSTTIFSPLELPTPTDIRMGSGAPGPAYWQQRVDHSIRATIDTDARAINASQTITYHNNSPHDLDYIWLSLEQNLFRTDSQGMALTTPGGRFGNRDGFEGGFDIEQLRVNGRPASLAVYDTIGRIDLDTPLRAGEKLSISMDFSFNIPQYGSDRLGIEDVEQGTVFQLAQWFPHPCVYDDVHGWNTLPYLGAGEFYTNFGDYDVEITAPREFVVVATGVLQNPSDVLTTEQGERFDESMRTTETVFLIRPEEVGQPESRPVGDGPLTWKYEAQDVRTFAWAASDAFIWDAASTDSSHGRISVQSVYPKEAERLWKDSTDMLRFAIEGYNARWMEYPYPTAINVSGIVGGMEYPMILFCRGRSSEEGLYGVTTHEIGHNWFPMVINTDERRHVWMDEGFTTFIQHYSTLERFGRVTRDRYEVGNLIMLMRRGQQQPIATRPDQVWRGRLGYLGYGKPAHGLLLLREQILGEERFDFAFNEYMRRWAFKSPQPADFFRTMEDASGEDLTWFWRGWFLEVTELDQAVVSVENEPENGLVFVTFGNERDMVMPVVYEVTYADGSTERRRLPVQSWYNANRFTTFWKTGGKRVVQIQIDPDEKFPDLNRSNNRWKN